MDVPSGMKLRGIEKYSSRGLKLMRIATAEASNRARLEEIVDRGKIGVALGFHAENPSVEDMLFLHRFYDGAGNWDMEGLSKAGGYSFFNFFRRKPDVATSLLSLLFDCHGSSITTVSACAAGNQAIGEAYRLIKSGRCDAMIAGGCEASLTFSGFVGFVLIRALTEKYSSPQKASRPFDRKRNGFVMSEGAGAVILENLEHAISRKAPIFGELLGYGSSADAYRITDTHPTGEGAALAMKQAIADASLTPDDVDYINAHGTSTIQNDLTETVAIRKVFGERAKRIPVSSNKSMMGHTIAAAGAIECILTIMGMNKATILPTINYDTRDPKCDLDYVPNEARIQEHAVSLCNSFGFGGQNGRLCLRRYDG
jgi:3-oxoacyl-[acyl-carrier-protein] synthase II